MAAVRAGLVVLAIVGCGRERDVPCNGVLDPGEFCDDGNPQDGDGCDCATRMIPPATLPPSSAAPIVLVEDGAWCWFQDERAIENAGYLVVSSISHGGDIQITSYDPATGERVDSQLHTRLERDDHDVASLLALPDGRTAAFWTRHDGFNHVFTRRGIPERARWGGTLIDRLDYDVTYTNPFLLAGYEDRVHLFVRGDEVNPTLLLSNDLGVSWNDGSQLLDAGRREYGRVFDHRPYVKYASDGTAVHLLYTDGHPAEFGRNSIYHLQYDGAFLRQTDGTLVAKAGPDNQPELSPDRGTLVFDGTVLPGGQAWIWDTEIGPDGFPVVVFSTFPDPERSYFDHRYKYARYDGTRWHVHDVAAGGTGIYVAEGFYSGGITIDPDEPSVVYFSSNVEPTSAEPTASGVFELYRAVTADEGATWTITAVTSGSRVDNLRPIVPARHTAPTTLVWMRGSYDTYLDFHTQIVALIGERDAVSTHPPQQDAELRALARFDLAATSNGFATPTTPGFVAAVPAAGFAQAVDSFVQLTVSNITGTREAVVAEPLYRGLVFNDRGGYGPSGKLRVELRWLAPNTPYIVRIHGHDTSDAYLKPTLWFRGDAKTLDSDDNAAFITAHRNVNSVAAGEGYTDLTVTSDANGAIALVARGLDYVGADHTAILSALELFEAPLMTPVARFDVDVAPGLNTAPGAVSLSFDDLTEWSGEATDAGITVRVTSDSIGSLHSRGSPDPMLADFIEGRDQLVVDVSGLEVGKLYAITVYSTDITHNQYASSRWTVIEPRHEPLVVQGFHMNLHRKDEGASFTFYHHANETSFRLRGEDVMTSLSTNPSLVIFNGIDIAVAP